MKSMFHHGYFREIFRQLRVPGIIAAAVLMLTNASALLNVATSLFSPGTIEIPSSEELALPLMAYVYIAGFILTFVSFGWLNHRSTCDFYHALPVKRTQIYFSTTLAIFLWMVIGVSAHVLVHTLLYCISGMPFNYLAYLCVYLNMLIGSIQIVGAVSLACALSGTRFVNIFASLFILFIPRFMLTVLAILIGNRTTMLPLTNICFLFNPSYNLFGMPYGSLLSLFSGSSVRLAFDNVLAMLYSLAHALLLLFAGSIVFRRRASELAGIPMRSRVLQAAIRVAFGLPQLLFLVLLYQNEAFSLTATVLLVLSSFTFYCLYELISTKRVKNMLKAMPLYSICIGIALLYLVLPSWIVKAANSVRADADNISGFCLITTVSFTPTYGDIQSQNVVIDDPEGIELVAKAYARAITEKPIGYEYRTKIVLVRSNGRNITRMLDFSPYEYDRLFEIAMRNDAYHTYRTEFPKSVIYYSGDVTPEEAEEIGKLFAEEYDLLDSATKQEIDAAANLQIWMPSSTYRTFYTLKVNGICGTENYSQNFAITECTPKSAQRYAEIMQAKNGEALKHMLTEKLSELDQDNLTSNAWALSIGNDLTLHGYDLYVDGKDTFTKQDFPECYEILRILANAEVVSDVSKSATVTCYDDNGQYTANLMLSEEDFQRISELIYELGLRIY